jgi:nucleoside phosphorylase
MEAAAVVWSCNQFNVPCICLKSITDIVREGEGGHAEFNQSLHGAAMVALAEHLPRLVSLVVTEVTL